MEVDDAMGAVTLRRHVIGLALLGQYAPLLGDAQWTELVEREGPVREAGGPIWHSAPGRWTPSSLRALNGRYVAPTTKVMAHRFAGAVSVAVIRGGSICGLYLARR
jgi:hypothetical protein